MRSIRFWVWSASAIAYGLFWLWYTPLGGPLTQSEIDEAMASLQANGASEAAQIRFRQFLEGDDGRPFIMVNIIDMAEKPRELPATGPDASADELLGHYMEYMWPALFSRASHPVFAGQAFASSMDIVGIEGAEHWETAALMRYRSRRDLWEIGSHPSFRDRHDYKVAALEKTIAFPVTPQLLLGDPRLILFLLVLSVVSLLDNFVLRRR